MTSPTGQTQGTSAQGNDTTLHSRQLFFAKISKTAGEDEVKLVFSQYGTVDDVIIFQASQGSGTSKGCGLVTMATHEEAAAALAGLHGKFSWCARDTPMVVTWMDSSLQHQRYDAFKASAKTDVPPPGCEPDAIKLFVGNIPLNYTEEQLLPLFQQIGQVVELVVVRNKANTLSKGCAFVWFATKDQAESAISMLNLKHILPDVSGKQHRPLVVRKARQGHLPASPNAPLSMLPSLGGSISSSSGMPALMHAHLPGAYGGALAVAARGGHRADWPGGTTLLGDAVRPVRPGAAFAGAITDGQYQLISQQGAGLHDPGHVLVQAADGMPMYVQVGAGAPQASPYQVMGGYQPQHQYVMVDMGAGQVLSHAADHSGALVNGYQLQGGYTAVAQTSAAAADGVAATAPAVAGALARSSQCSVTFSVDGAQMAQISGHLHTIQNLTQCSVLATPGGPGLFNLVVSGAQSNVQRAQQLLLSVVQGASGASAVAPT